MTDRPLVCLIEDDPIMGESLCLRLELEGFDTVWHQSAIAARDAIAKRDFSLVISDIRLPDLGGDELYAQLRTQGLSLPPFIFVTGFGAIDRAVALLKMGAADYITKPFDIEQLIEKVRALAVPRPPAGAEGDTALGISPAMRRIAALLPQMARHANTLLLTGESGVGKERVAEHFDRLARENEKCPFVAVNCGAITETLFESELFGHEKGAFTGAARTRKGFFEQAHCGTLFLDEIGELPLSLQVKLLRAIQERRVTRVGGESPIPVTLRLICATNQDLKALVAQGRFREDLFYRINVVSIRIPPLRERPEDILWLARRFIEEFAREHATGRHALHPSAEQLLMQYPWPGNVRELKHTIERACIVSPDLMLMPDALFDDTTTAGVAHADGAVTLEEHMQVCERAYIRRMLDANSWQIAATAQALGISRKNLWEKMRKLGIQES